MKLHFIVPREELLFTALYISDKKINIRLFNCNQRKALDTHDNSLKSLSTFGEKRTKYDGYSIYYKSYKHDSDWMKQLPTMLSYHTFIILTRNMKNWLILWFYGFILVMQSLGRICGRKKENVNAWNHVDIHLIVNHRKNDFSREWRKYFYWFKVIL